MHDSLPIVFMCVCLRMCMCVAMYWYMRVPVGSRQILLYANLPCIFVFVVMADVLKEITQASLGRIRKTSESPPRVSVLDVIRVITGTSPTVCSHTLSRLEERFPEVGSNMSNFQFPGSGRPQSVTHAASQRSSCYSLALQQLHSGRRPQT